MVAVAWGVVHWRPNPARTSGGCESVAKPSLPIGTGSGRETLRLLQEDGGPEASFVRCDVAREDEVRELVAAAVSRHGRLDVMVNNACVSYPSKIADASPEHWRAMLETNVLALLAGSQAAIRAMRACKAHGHIVNISSIAALRRDSGVYGATKHP